MNSLQGDFVTTKHPNQWLHGTALNKQQAAKNPSTPLRLRCTRWARNTDVTAASTLMPGLSRGYFISGIPKSITSAEALASRCVDLGRHGGTESAWLFILSAVAACCLRSLIFTVCGYSPPAACYLRVINMFMSLYVFIVYGVASTDDGLRASDTKNRFKEIGR